MSEPYFIFVSSVFPMSLGVNSSSVQNSVQDGVRNGGAPRVPADEALRGLRWLNPGFGEKFMLAHKIDAGNFFTPACYPLGEKEAEAFFRSLENMNGDSALHVKTMWAQEIARQTGAQSEARSEKAALGKFVAGGGVAETAGPGAGPSAGQAAVAEQLLADERNAALAKAQQFLLMAFFLEKTQADIQSIIAHLSDSRRKMDEALGFLKNLSGNGDKNIRDQAGKGLEDLHALSSSLPEAQDFYGLVREAADSGLNKPDWRFLLSSVVAFAPRDAVLVAQSKELEQDLKERDLWNAPEAQLTPEDAGLDLDSLRDLQQKGVNCKILSLSLAEILGMGRHDAARPWLDNKRALIVLKAS